MLGEFEYLLLTAAASLCGEAYGASIRRQIETATGRSCSIGALYITLDRMESPGQFCNGPLQNWSLHSRRAGGLL
jgi:PadR family transcriptional regulator PadR